MRKLIMILTFGFSSCGHEPKTIPSATTTNSSVTDTTNELMKLKPVDDPYFVETQDTISMTGPHSITRNVLQDKNGNYWFATWEGIIRYDGKLFTNFTLKEGLLRFHVFSLLEDKTGNLWFGTIRGGVYRYNGNSFTLFTTKNGLVSNFIECIQEDKEGNIWFGTDEGVSRYNGKTFTNFTIQDGLSANFVHSIAQDKTGKLWFATHGGVSCYDGKSFTDFKNKENQIFSNVRSIIEDNKGSIWIGSENGLTRYDRKSLTNFRYNFTGYIFEDKRGNLWLSEGKVNSRGMALTKYNGKSFTEIKSGNQIFGITEDRTGNIWFGTENGVCRYDGKSVDDFAVR